MATLHILNRYNYMPVTKCIYCNNTGVIQNKTMIDCANCSSTGRRNSAACVICAGRGRIIKYIMQRCYGCSSSRSTAD